MKLNNILGSIPDSLDEEICEILAKSWNVRVERIISKGHTSPESGWYDQEQDEWVLVLKGNAVISFEDEAETHLSEGDYINIPAGMKHKVSWTNPETETIWLAIHY